jgi:hypothetical protein
MNMNSKKKGMFYKIFENREEHLESRVSATVAALSPMACLLLISLPAAVAQD